MERSSILELKRRVRFVIAEPRDLPEDRIYSKERKLIEEIKKELQRDAGARSLRCTRRSTTSQPDCNEF